MYYMLVSSWRQIALGSLTRVDSLTVWGKCHEVTKGDRRRQRLDFAKQKTEGEKTTPPSKLRFATSPDKWRLMFSTCGSHFHKLNFPHNNNHFLIFNITFFTDIFKLYMQIELSRNYEITLFLMVWQKSYRHIENHTKENVVKNFVFKQ